MSAKRISDAEFHRLVVSARGDRCRACGSTTWIQADHIVPRSQGGPSNMENGLPLCEPCHRAKTEHRLAISPEWLDEDQVAWLAAVRWVAWDEHGEPYGRGWRNFQWRRGSEHGDTATQG